MTAPAFLDRRGPSDLDRPAWLAARRNGISASEIAKLGSYKSNASRVKAYGTLAEEKIAAGGNDWRGARMDAYRARGNGREPVLEEWAEFAFGFTPESRLAFAESDRQHLASVDGWKVNSEGQVVLAELKTTNEPLTPVICDKKGYVDQVQWQMHVTGAVETLILWEERLDDGEGGFKPGARGTVLIVRDQARIDQLVGYASAFLVVLMERMTGSDGSVEDPMLDDVVTRLMDAKALVAELDPQVRTMMSSSGMTSAKTAKWNVSYESGDPKPVADPAAFAKAHPKEVKRVKAISDERTTMIAKFDAEHVAELTRIAELAASFTKMGDKPNPTLRITPRKDAK